MSAFTGPLTITELDVDVQCWRLESPLVYEVGSLGSGKKIEVPVGFVTDGASVPRFLWWFLPPWGKYSRPAVIHDYLCVQIEKDTPHIQASTREQADAIFFEAMGVTGVGRIKKWILWIGVRIGAGIYMITGHTSRNTKYD
jgi:hypothetical protein